MIRKIGIPILLLSLLASGCVSKKKFVEMESQKNKYQKESRDLKNENGELKTKLQNGETDFNLMRNALQYNDAAKGTIIDSLKASIKSMQDNFSVVENELTQTKDLVKDQQYYNSKSNSDIARLEMTIRQLERDTASLSYSLQQAEKKSADLKNQMDNGLTKLNEKNDQIALLNKTISDNQKSISSLKNDVAKIKDQLKQAGDAFIALRKEMLTAKDQKNFIDPNNNANISKISKALGQY